MRIIKREVVATYESFGGGRLWRFIIAYCFEADLLMWRCKVEDVHDADRSGDRYRPGRVGD